MHGGWVTISRYAVQEERREGGREDRTYLSVGHAQVAGDGGAEGEDKGVDVGSEILDGNVFPDVGAGHELDT